MQSTFLQKPFTPVLGNHDNRHNHFKHLFRLNSESFDSRGSTYTYVYGEAQFFAINGEQYGNSTYFTDMKTWMQNQINANPNIKWRIVYFHKSAYTGTDLQNWEIACRDWRQAITPILDALNIDLVLFGHDHVYQVIGPVYNKKLVDGSVSNVQSAPYDPLKNVSAKKGGIFNVNEGTLYFCNGHIGWYPFYPLPFSSMPGSQSGDIPDYPSLFTGMFGQPGNSTFSNVSVSTENIVITTYEIDNGNSQFLDEIKIVKYCEPYTQGKVEHTSNLTFNNTTLIIGEELHIKNNATVTFNNSTLRFYENARVVIEPGSKLVIDNTTLTNSCPDKLWRGIFVGGNINQPQTAQYQGTVELKNGAVIENSRNGVATYNFKTNGSIDFNTTGGIIKASNTTFKNNRRSVEFMSYVYSNGGRIAQNVSYFINCDFIVNDNNLFATSNTSFLYHFSMWDVTGVTIKGCNFKNNISTMPDRKQAIYTESAGYIVDEYCRSLSATECECPNSRYSTFTGFNKAIESLYLGKQYAIKVDHSNFADNITGVKLYGQNNIQISRSNMSLNCNYSNKPVGIFFDFCTGYKVEGNTIQLGRTAIPPVGTPTGILIDHAGTDENRIYRNTISEIYKGMAELSREALFNLKTDSIIDLNQIRDWYDEMYNLSAKYSLAETYYQLEQFDKGFETLHLIPEKYNLNENEMIEHNNYVSLFTFKNQIRESGRTIAELTEEEINQMRYFAHASHGLSSAMARGVLCFFYEICIEDEIMRGLDDEMIPLPSVSTDETEDENQSSSAQSVSSEFQKNALENIKIHPNPTTGVLNLIQDRIENLELRIESVEVYDVYGRKVLEPPLTVLRSYDLTVLQAGIYFVKITTAAGEVTKKIVKQ